MTEIKPAMAAEEWAMAPKVYFRKPEHFVCNHANCPCHVDPTRQHMQDAGYGVELTKDADMAVWDDSWGLTVDKANRHALGALCLYGQPFGFTRDDVRRLRSLGAAIGVYRPDVQASLEALAGRIAALLPPE